jgi:AbrB family looped-hinge helix DNA binding protein
MRTGGNAPGPAAGGNASTPPAPVVISYRFLIDGDCVMSSKDVATLSSKFQISIPKAIRSARKWQPGQKFAFIPKDGGVMLVPVPRWEDLAGSMPGANTEDYRDRNDRY